MKPVTQTILHTPGGGNGNCFAACIASIFEVPLDENVPNFVDYQGPLAWYDAARAWCRSWGYDLGTIGSLDVVERWADTPPGDHAIASVPSPRGLWKHCVVVDRHGVVVHDPYPDAPVGYQADAVDFDIVIQPYHPWPTQPAELDL